MSKKVGMYGGKFLVVHSGHVYSMIKASTMVDELHVIVSYDTEFEKKKLFKDAVIDHVSFEVRLRWWHQITKDMPHVHVHAVEEKQTGEFSDWEKGAEGIKAVIKKEIDVVFSSEEEYGVYFDKLYPSARHIVIDSERQKYNVSATKLRTEGVMKHWNMLPEVVKPYFVKKVVIVGTESCGKSTLVKNLANLYNTNYVEEFGRTYYERLGNCADVTLTKDYAEIAFEHKYQEKKQTEKANKVLFIDTEAVVTQYYAHLYLDYHDNVVEEIIKAQEYDLWIFLEIDVDWIDDGTRLHGEDQTRRDNNEYLKNMLEERDISYTTISGSFEGRLSAAIDKVDELLEGG